MQTPPSQAFSFCGPPKDQVSRMLSGASNTDDPGGTTALCNLGIKDFSQVSSFLSLKSESKQMQPLVSSTQASYGFNNVAKISVNSHQNEVLHQNSACLLISECRDSAQETHIHYPDMSLSSSLFSHCNPVSSRDNHHSFSNIYSSESSSASLVATEQQPQSELDIRECQNLLSSSSHVFRPLYGISSSVCNTSSDGKHALYGVHEGKQTYPSFTSDSSGVSCVIGNRNDSTTCNKVYGQLTCGTLLNASSSCGQETWNGPLLEQVYHSLLDSLNDEVPQPLNGGFSSSLSGEESQFEGIPVKNVTSSSHVCTSSIGAQGMDSMRMLANGKTSMQYTSLDLTQSEDLFDSLLNFKHDKGLRFWDDNLPACMAELDANSLLDQDQKYLDMGSEGLLDSVVAKIRSTDAVQDSDDMISKSSLTKTNSMSMYNSQVKCENYSQNVGSLQIPPDDVNAEERFNPSQNDTSSISQAISWARDTHSISIDVSMFEKVSDDPFKVNKKRARPGESTRPRPKDRQQIQDRVKELREIVPNGAKCSIDGLLDRTVKHMIFLQSVAKHAEKLKHAREPKSASGATWGFGLGHESPVSPIIVEDLNQPGQMLIEMLCEERGFFLEIAEVIRGFNLSILKGVMEARDGKIWAHFVVEANWGITRMDIFTSLAQFFDQTTNNNPNPSNVRPELHADAAIFPGFHPTAVPSMVRVAERFQ